jgi:diguanylate cyclase (GGDEF)-like protein
MNDSSTVPSREGRLRLLAETPDRLTLLVEALLALGAGNFDAELGVCFEVLSRTIPVDSVDVYLKRGSNYLHYSNVTSAELPSQMKTSPLTLPEEAAGQQSSVYWAPQGFDIRTGPTAGPSSRALIVRLTSGGEQIGVVIFSAAQGREFTPDDRDFLVLLQPKLSSAMAVSLAFRKLESDAMMDPVTDTLNSRAILRRLEDEIHRARREHRTMGLLFIDLNDLKAINDSHGHAAGDEVLRQAASAMAASMRGYDALGRIGGDEFLAILPGLDASGIEARIKLLKQEASKTRCLLPDGVELSPGLSIGGAVYPDEASDSKALIAVSDRRMYEDKVRYRKQAAAGEPVSAKP